MTTPPATIPTYRPATSDEIMATAVVEIILQRWEDQASELALAMESCDADATSEMFRRIAQAHHSAREVIVAARNNDSDSLADALANDYDRHNPVLVSEGDVVIRLLKDLQMLFGADDGTKHWEAIMLKKCAANPGSAFPLAHPQNRAQRRASGGNKNKKKRKKR